MGKSILQVRWTNSCLSPAGYFVLQRSPPNWLPQRPSLRMNTGYAPKVGGGRMMDGQHGTDSICGVPEPVGFWASPCTVQTWMLRTVPPWMEAAGWSSITWTFPKNFISVLSSFESKHECISLYCYLQNHPWGMKSFCVPHTKIWQPREAGTTLQNCSIA